MAAQIPLNPLPARDADAIVTRYTTPGNPEAFSGINNVSRQNNVTDDFAAEALGQSEAYTLHRQYRRPPVKNPYYIMYIRQQLQVDLIDMRQLSEHNISSDDDDDSDVPQNDPGSDRHGGDRHHRHRTSGTRSSGGGGNRDQVGRGRPSNHRCPGRNMRGLIRDRFQRGPGPADVNNRSASSNRPQRVAGLAAAPRVREINRGYNYILAAIDCFSRKLWAKKLKTKEGLEVVEAMREIFTEMRTLPKTVFADKGKELKNQYMQNFLREKNVRLMHPNSEVCMHFHMSV